MKKFAILLLVVCVGLFCLTACNDDKPKSFVNFTQEIIKPFADCGNKILQTAEDRDKLVSQLTNQTHIDKLNSISNETFKNKTVLFLPVEDACLYEENTVKNISFKDGVITVERVLARDFYADQFCTFVILITVDKIDNADSVVVTFK